MTMELWMLTLFSGKKTLYVTFSRKLQYNLKIPKNFFNIRLCNSFRIIKHTLLLE